MNRSDFLKRASSSGTGIDIDASGVEIRKSPPKAICALSIYTQTRLGSLAMDGEFRYFLLKSRQKKARHFSNGLLVCRSTN
ncbi:MAG: hypothetical protein RPR97_10940, partial [Colwellia sp.]